MATQELASWAVGLQFANLTAPVLAAAITSITNWAGCAIGGYMQTAPRIALNTTSLFFGGPATSTILGAANTSLRTDAYIAALVNGIAGHIDDYDDTHLETIIHPAGTVAAALLAVSEWKSPVSGSKFMTAFVAGVEAELKLGLSVYPQHYDVGWHITSTTGSIGAAVAVGKLLGLDVPTMQQAIGIACTQVVGMQEMFGSDTKSFHVGRAAQGGMMAALLANGGYTSSLQGLEAEFGWAHVVSTRENLTAEFDTLGKVWEVQKNTFKPYPCGIVIHPTIEASLGVRATALGKGLLIEDITSVEVRANPQVLVLTGKTDPQTGLEGKFSIYHASAASLIFGEATPSQFTNAVVLNSTVVALRKKVNITTDATVNKDEAFVTAIFKDGSNVTQHIDHVIGSLDNQLSEAQLQTKFQSQAMLVLGESRAKKAYDAFTNIANMSDVGNLVKMFAGSESGSNSTSSGATQGSGASSTFYVNGVLAVLVALILGSVTLL